MYRTSDSVLQVRVCKIQLSIPDSEPNQHLLAFEVQRCVQPASPCVCRFINARRRILQPMLDASSSETPKAKKKTPQNRPLQRFWPDSIAAGGTQQQVAMPDGRQHNTVSRCFCCCTWPIY